MNCKVTHLRLFLRYHNLTSEISNLALPDHTELKIFFENLKLVDREGYKVFPPAQGRPGRNGQHISGYHTSSNTIDFNVSEVCSIVPYIRLMPWYVFREPQGGHTRPPKIVILAHLGHFRGSTLTPLKDPQTPLPS